MLVSIVTPSYNQSAYLEKTIQSVLSQTYPKIEYILVDGGSTDNSIDIIQKYKERFAWWVSELDQGQTDAINKGFAKANGEVFAWLNSDDMYTPYAVAEAVSFLIENPEVGLVYGDADFIDDHDQISGRFPARQTDYRRLMQGYVHIPQQSAFFRASLWHKVGPLDPTFFFAMDYDLWVRIAKIAPIKYHPLLWAKFRIHQAAKTDRADSRCWPEMLKVYRREGGRLFSWFVFKAKIRPFIYAWIPLHYRLMMRKWLP